MSGSHEGQKYPWIFLYSAYKCLRVCIYSLPWLGWWHCWNLQICKYFKLQTLCTVDCFQYHCQQGALQLRSVAVLKHCNQKQLGGRKGFIWLTLSNSSPSLRESRGGTQAETEAESGEHLLPTLSLAHAWSGFWHSPGPPTYGGCPPEEPGTSHINQPAKQRLPGQSDKVISR